MKRLIAIGAAAFALALGVPAGAQTMERHDTMRVDTPSGTTVTRTVEQRPDGSQTVRRTVDRSGAPGAEVRRTEVRRTVVRRTVRSRMVRRGWHGNNRHCVTKWRDHRRVTRCWYTH